MARPSSKETGSVTAKITVEIPGKLDEFLTVQRAKRNPRTGKKVRNRQIVTAALDLLKKEVEERGYDFLEELRKRDELALDEK